MDRQLLKNIELERPRPTNCVQQAMNLMHHQRSKQIDFKYHWIRDMVASKAIKLIYMLMTEQRADFLTKTLPGDVF